MDEPAPTQPQQPSSAAPARRSLLLLAFASGTAGLVYEVIWMRWFRLLFGSTAYSASVTLCAFFLGLALGSWLLGGLAGRTARPLRAYAWVEGGAAACALAVPVVLGGYDLVYGPLYASLAETREVFVLAKLVLALVAMLPASTLLGGALPLLAATGLESGSELGGPGNRLYGANLVGGVAGAAAAGLLLPEWIGVPAAYGVGVAATLLAAAGALWLDRSPRVRRPPSPHSPSRRVATFPVPASALWVAAVSGFGVIAFQVLLVAALGQSFAHTAYSFGLVLVTVIGSMASGAWLVSASEGRLSATSMLSWVLAVEGLLLFVSPWAAVWLRGQMEAGGLLAGFATTPIGQSVTSVGVLGLPALFVAALVFPLTFRLVGAGPAGPSLGRLMAVNTASGIAGSLAVSFVMLPLLGLWGSFALLGLAYAVSSLVVARPPRLRQAAAVAAVLSAVTLLPANPWQVPRVRLQPGEQLLDSLEGAHGLVSVVERDGFRYLAIDQHYVFGSTSHTALYERMGRLPLLLHPDPKRVLVVGSATGGLAAGPASLPVEAIGLVEIVPEVHTLAARHFAAHNRGVHADPRARLITEDGRNHLRATPDRYDVVVEDLYVAERPSAAAMYSRDHYRDVRDRLTERGVFCQWLPLYQLSRTQLGIIVGTFLEVFPKATVWTPSFAPPWILGLCAAPGGYPDAETLARSQEGASAHADDPWLHDREGVFAFYLGSAARLAARVPALGIHSDAHPLFEFVSARTPGHRAQRFASTGWPLLVQELLAHPDADDAHFPFRPPGIAAAGQQLARLNGTHPAAIGPADWREIEARIPSRLLASRDASVSRRWPPRSERSEAR